MANGYKVTIQSIVTDATNIYVTLSINDGIHEFPPITPIFSAGTSAATITAYAQAIATEGPVLGSDLAALVNSSVTA